MNLTIKSIILWPKDETKKLRTISFAADKVNVITGGSEKGKSAIISIIDYCLGSGDCKIPTRTIRDYTAWFGVLFRLNNNQELLLVRKEPGNDRSSGEMFMKQDTGIVIPERIKPNCNFDDVKHKLNGLGLLPYIDFEKGEFNSGFQSRPSFRDMVSFTFQPQYIVANQSSLYYKADSAKHREKLRTIFPYVLSAVDNEYLELKEELRQKDREASALEIELTKRKKIADKWLGEIRAYYITAKEYGLLDKAPYPNDDWKPEEYLEYLRKIPEKMTDNTIPMVPEGATSLTTDRLVKLQENEIQIAFTIQNLKTRQELIKKIDSSNRGFRESLLDEHGRLGSTGWFNKKIEANTICPFCETESPKAKKYIRELILVNNGILEKGQKTNDHHTVLNDELEKLNKEILSNEKKLNIVREEMKGIQSSGKKDEKRIQTIQGIYKFIGQLESELKNYEIQLDNSELSDNIVKLRIRIKEINSSINQEVIDRKLQNAKRKITDSIKHYAKIFNAANHNEEIEFNIKDLTINFISRNGRYEALYEIGSGSNYMAYHISTLLALHEFFLSLKKHPVPNFIVFDQPSQAYFPDTDVETSEKNEDINRVKRIFEALSSAIKRTKGNLQIIVLEHVGKYAWEGIDDINLVKRWRDGESDDALILNDWIGANNTN